MDSPLAGIRVLEIGGYFQAPVAAEILGEFGAEVIKIEEPGVGDPVRGIVTWAGIPTALKGGRNWIVEHNNANKKSITLNLKHERGKQVLYQLVKKSDVFIHNFRESAVKELGFDYKTLSRYNPRLIYASGSGYGREGPERELVAFDRSLQARSGMMANVGEVGGPPAVNLNAPVDIMGATLLVIGVLLAVVARERAGIGQEVDVSLLGSAIQQERLSASAFLATGQEYEKHDRKRARNALWNHYPCADGGWIMLGMAQSDRYWPDFCKALGAENLINDPRFNSWDKRDNNREELISILDKIFLSKDRDYWLKALGSHGDLGFAPINTVADLPGDPQVVANNYVAPYDHPVLGMTKVIGRLVQLSRTPGKERTPAPELGEHTEEVLLGLGICNQQELSELKDLQVI